MKTSAFRAHPVCIFCILVVAALFASPPQHALAQPVSACAPAVPVSGDNVVCNGVGTGVVDPGFNNGTITVNSGSTVLGINQGLLVGDNVGITNDGQIVGLGIHGVQGNTNVTVTNNGTIDGFEDGVNLGDNGTVINNGTIFGLTDDGVELEANGRLENNGLIQSLDEGADVTGINTTVINRGTILSVDDGINVGENATVINTGLVRSVGGRDGIDIDSGVVINSGTIEAIGIDDGIDFDPSLNSSTVNNSGLIIGNLAINTDPADTASQTVINSGTLTGLGGVAVNLGAGDDHLVLQPGYFVNGQIELGTGTDSLSVQSRSARVLTFGSVPETISTLGPSLLQGTTLVLIDPAPLSQSDRLTQEIGFGLANATLDSQRPDGFWARSFASGGSITASQNANSDFAAGGSIWGFGTGWNGVSVFAGYGLGQSELDDDSHEVRTQALITGLSLSQSRGQTLFDAAFYLGGTRSNIDSSDIFSGDADYLGVVAGLSLRTIHQLMAQVDGFFGLDLQVQGDLLYHGTESYRLTGLRNGRVGDRDTVAAAVRIELGAPVTHQSMDWRPYLAVSVAEGKEDEIDFSALGQSITFDAANVLDEDFIALGLTVNAEAPLSLPVPLSGRFEAALNEDSAHFSASLGTRF